MNKWAYYGMGLMSGVILVLLTIVFLRDGASYEAHAGSRSGGMGAADWSLMTATGGVLQQTQDVMYIVYKRPAGENEKKLLGKSFEGDRITLCAYRVFPSGGMNQGTVKLITAREISYDLKLIASDPDTLRSFKEIKKAYDDAVKKANPSED